LEDLFDPARPQVTIELNPVLSPEENIGWLFHQYRKAKAGRDRLAVRASETEREIALLEELAAVTENARSLDELAALKPRIRKAGLALPEERPSKRRGAQAPRGPRVFRSAEGLDILVARNRNENDRLTFGIARGNDYWMHLLTWPGPHVVIRKPPDKSVSQESLLDAAHLAVYFSKIRGAGYAQVAYTQCKNVRRMKGAPRGKVNYAHATTLQVRIEQARIERLMKGTPEQTEKAP
jgi:predicted ribosome quality control (RQC) complex YloA/Tae2 family protein